MQAVDEVVVPGTMGEFGVLPDHIPLLSTMNAGILRFREEKSFQLLAVSNGYAEIGANNHVLVLTEHAVPAKDIDAAQAQQDYADAEERLKAWTGEENAEYGDARRSVALGSSTAGYASRVAE